MTYRRRVLWAGMLGALTLFMVLTGHPWYAGISTGMILMLTWDM